MLVVVRLSKFLKLCKVFHCDFFYNNCNISWCRGIYCSPEDIMLGLVSLIFYVFKSQVLFKIGIRFEGLCMPTTVLRTGYQRDRVESKIKQYDNFRGNVSF